MKIVLLTFGILVLIVTWLFATATTINGEHNRTAFKIKSLFYWMAVISSFCLGYIVASKF